MNEKVLKIWEAIITVTVLLTSFLIPYKVCFIYNDNHKFSIDIVVNILYFIDIIFNFCTNNQQRFNFSENFFEYVKTWFIIDILSIFPFNLIVPQNKNRWYQIYSLLELFKTIKLVQNRNVNKCLNLVIRNLRISKNVWNCIKLVYAFAYLNHLCACLFYFLARIRNLDYTTWIYKLGIIDKDNFEIYIWSLYWNLTTVTTVGYGNISAYSWIEKIYTIIIICIGVVLYSFFIGTLSIIVSQMNEHQIELKDKINQIEQIRLNYPIENETYIKVKKAIKFNTYKTQIDTQKFIQELPNKIKTSVINLLNDKTIKQFHMFKGTSNLFISAVVPLFSHFIMFQNDILYEQLEIVDSSKIFYLYNYYLYKIVYSIAKGTIVYCMSKKYNEKEVRFLSKCMKIYIDFFRLEFRRN